VLDVKVKDDRSGNLELWERFNIRKIFRYHLRISDVFDDDDYVGNYEDKSMYSSQTSTVYLI
jgi:hypothetical protein